MLAKAVAHHTTASFIRVVGSEFVQKYLGEGPRMVRDVFRLAKENAPAIIFVDEVDAIATARFGASKPLIGISMPVPSLTYPTMPAPTSRGVIPHRAIRAPTMIPKTRMSRD